MSEKIIAIVGVTGNQGGSVAALFSQLAGWQVRGLTRDPTKPSATALQSQGIEVVATDLNDTESLKKAFAGATVIFAITDFWQHIQDPSAHALAQSRGVTINEIAYEQEVRQGKNIVDAAAANVETLTHFILGTLNSSKKLSKGKITFNLHFDAKWEAVEYCKSAYPQLWAKTSLLQLGIFASNWKSGMAVPRKGEDGRYKLQIAMSGDRNFPMVDVNKDTGTFVRMLLSLPPNTNLMGCGSLLSWNTYCAIWSRVNNVPVDFEKIDGSVLEQTLGTVGREFADMFRYIEAFGYDGGDEGVVYPWEVRERFGVEVEGKWTTVEEYVEGEDWSSVL
ncbi:NAD(P)-binding protein [Lentithecium fluviatile CBS 122367]|uniref:NAD(P)-binding protein n=1 Tax=Lentithecium fluviatile CBS 122367 TaxID=1168545 RepID=A0A6G1IJ72_9PLEO|nr:NAD(P)-binding protein [Lentithecium fluviatile CBS 122367]